MNAGVGVLGCMTRSQPSREIAAASDSRKRSFASLRKFNVGWCLLPTPNIRREAKDLFRHQSVVDDENGVPLAIEIGPMDAKGWTASPKDQLPRRPVRRSDARRPRPRCVTHWKSRTGMAILAAARSRSPPVHEGAGDGSLEQRDNGTGRCRRDDRREPEPGPRQRPDRRARRGGSPASADRGGRAGLSRMRAASISAGTSSPTRPTWSIGTTGRISALGTPSTWRGTTGGGPSPRPCTTHALNVEGPDVSKKDKRRSGTTQAPHPFPAGRTRPRHHRQPRSRLPPGDIRAGGSVTKTTEPPARPDSTRGYELDGSSGFVPLKTS